MSTFSLAKVIRLLEKANEQDVNVSFLQDELSVHVQKGKQIDKSLFDELKLNKPFLIHYFKNFANNGSKADLSPIQKIDKKLVKRIPLSFAQERLWFIHQLEGSEPYHLPTVLRLKGTLNSGVLAHTLQSIVNRHEVLRTVILEEDGKGFQHIKVVDQWRLSVVDGAIYKDSPQALQSFIGQLIIAPFNLSQDDMLRATLINIDVDDHVLVVTMHHIASDGWSNSILVREVVELYSAYLEGRKVDWPLLGIQYADYANWQRTYLQGEVLYKKLEYWKNKLDGVATLQLPADYVRPLVQSVKGDNISFSIDKAMSNQLQQLSQQHGATLFMTLLAVYKAMLYRYSGQPDICVGTSFAMRERQELEGLIGFFVNTLALRDEVNAESSFTQLLQQVKDTTLEAYEHQDIPFEKVVEVVAKERETGRNPLFQVMLVLANTPEVSELRLGQLKLSFEEYEQKTAKFEITFFITETPNGLQGLVQYSTDLYHADTIKRMTAHFETLLRSVVKNPEQKIGLLPMLTRGEDQQLLEEFNNSKASYPKDKHVVSLFEEQVVKTPDATALVFEGNKLSYQQLNEMANQLAHYLRSRGVKEESLVPICMERGLDMMVGIIGILKAGAAYVPIDAEFPAGRISYMLEDTGSAILLCNSESRASLAIEADVDIIEIDGGLPEIQLQPTHNLSTNLAPSNAAYVIYTSGSTGKPKGVIIEHRNLVDYVFGLNRKVQINDCKSFALVSTIATDLGNTVIYASLLSGGALHLFSKEATTNVETLHQYFTHHKIECLKIVPSHWKALCMEDKLLLPAKLLVFGGEALRTEMVENIQASNSSCKVANHYGPTETTIGKLLHIVESDKKYGTTIPIGKPFSNTSVYVLSAEMQLNPIGVPGQLFIAGDGVARGYFNKPEITKEKFVADPFAEEKGSLMYATGDLVKYLADGNIEFIGRVDDQVKIRGYRIELGEIETIINQCYLVSQAVVLAREDKQGNKRLIGYIVPEGAYEKDEIIAYLKEKLPEYMVPALLVQLEVLPLTANGKIDRKVLPDPDIAEMQSNEFAAPRNDAEKALAEIWRQLLDMESVGIHDNFFELGGDSIITIQLVSRARRAGYELQMGDVFTYQTIARLSALLDQRSDTSATLSGEQFLLEGACGLLPIQQWYFDKEPVEVSHFNQSVLLTIDKSVTESLLKRAMEQLTAHHDALRFKYYKKEGCWYQVYEHQNEVSRVITEDLQAVSPDALAALITEHSDKLQRSLDIEKGELVRVVLMQTPASETANRLLIVIHHLAIDGVSWRILLEDLELLLSGLKNAGTTDLGNKTTSYRQWHHALVKYGQSKKALSQKPYWNKVIKNQQSLPVDKEYNESVKIKDTRHHAMRLGVAQTRRLTHDVPRVYHTKINDILIAALAKTLAGFANAGQVIIGMEGHGREHTEEGIDTSRTVGWFTTHYPVLLKVGSGMGEDSLIKSIKEQLRQVPDMGLGFGVLKYINKEEAYQGKPCWDLVFNYLGQVDNVFNAGRMLGMATESAGADRSPEYVVNEKLAVNGMVQDGELVLHWTYSDQHYYEETVVALVQKFKDNLELLITHCIDQQKKSGAVFTPSDYGLGKEISYDELDIFLNQPHKGEPRKAALESLHRLSGLQQGMLFHGLYDGGIGIYMRQLNADLTGLDTGFFNETWSYILQQHNILRSGFYHEDFKIPVQCVYRTVSLPLEILDLSSMNGEEQSLAVLKYEEKSRAGGFDFKSPPLMRIGLLRLSGGRYRMVWTWHHILFDGWSMAILMEVFLKKYQLLSAGKSIAPEAEDHYEDYIQYIDRGNKENEEAYWRNYMQGVEQSTRLPFINAGAERNKGIGVYKVTTLTLGKTVSANIQNFAQGKRITVNTLMQAVWCYILHSYTGNSHVSFGVIVSGRPDDMAGVEQRVGLYINTLPLHSQIQEEATIEEWLVGLQNEQVLSRQFQYAPLQDIQNFTGVAGDLFDTIMVFENYPVSKLLSSGENKIGVENVVIHEHNNYALTITINNAEQVSISFSYNSTLLEEECVKMIAGHFEHVMLQVINHAGSLVKDIQLITAVEEHQLLTAFNDNDTPYPVDKSIIDLFEQQVAETPAATAIVFESGKISYQELNNRSNQLANYLIKLGVKNGGFVPLCMERSIEMMIAILGILKAGAAYVPIDPAYPFERIRYMLSDVDCSVIITGGAYKNIFEEEVISTHLICLDETADLLMSSSSGNVTGKISPADLAYIIYTSGSTGKPKGVMVTHGNVVSLVKEVDYVSFSNEDVLLSTGSPSFDATTFEYWGMLLNGGQLVLCAENKLLDIELLKNEIEKRKVKKMWFTAGWFNRIVDTDISVFQGLETILAGGEKLSEPHIQKLRNAYPELEILNGYGPTENTTFSLVYKFTGSYIKSPIPIGRPLNNRKAYVLNKHHRLVPVGVAGEIFVGGAGLSKGYLKRSELTEDKFITNPFNTEKDEKIYKTGDQGKWLPDGNIEYLGRIDQQVKIRGFRIELGEIETVLLQYEMVKQAVVMMREDKEGVKRLVGYVVMAGFYDRDSIVSYLKDKLPEYMVPALWVELESFPLTRNGKIDKDALPDPEIAELSGEKYVAPRNEIEEKLAVIWQDLLGLDLVGIEDNFFELGGDSIITIQLVSRVKHAGYELQVADVFTHETISGLSSVIEQRMGKLLTISGEQSQLDGFSGLLPIQQWYFEKEQPAISHFNQSVLLCIDKTVTVSVLQQAVERLMVHHDSLRFKYYLKDGRWMQEYGLYKGAVITEDLRSITNAPTSLLITERADIYQRNLHIFNGELVRVVWMQTPGDETYNRLLIVIHHLAVDGVSWRILLEDLERLISGLLTSGKTDLGNKTSSYRQWCHAIGNYSHSSSLLSQLTYWQQAVKKYNALPVDKLYEGPVRVKDRERLLVKLGDIQTRRLLQEVPKVYHTEINDILLAALADTLCRWSGNNTIMIGLEGHGRENIEEGIDTSRTVGWFTSLYPLLLELETNNGEADLIKTVKEQLRLVPDKGLGYGVLKYIKQEETLQEPAPWDIVFNYLGQLDNTIKENKWLKQAGESAGEGVSGELIVAEKLSVNGFVQAGELVLNWSYSKRHYEDETVRRLAEDYIFNLQKIIDHCMERQRAGTQLFTPSDFGLGSEITYKELDQFLGGLQNRANSTTAGLVESIYRLSGLQQGMLFHGLYDDASGAYMVQFGCDLVGTDLQVFRKSWHYVMKKHSILRSAFYPDEFNIPVQCVYTEVDLPVEILDYRDMSEIEQEAAIKEYQGQDRYKGFDFKVAPLMRIALIHIGEARYRMLWTTHHILFDGWSLPILLEEFLTIYELLAVGKQVLVEPVDRYEDYIHFIEDRSKEQQKLYWQKYLKGVETGSLLPFIETTTERNKGVGEYKSLFVQMDNATTARINRFAQASHITVNTIIQGVWAFLLHKYTGSSNVVYGVTVSGRPDDLPGVEQRVGMFINTVPLHSVMQEGKEIATWLKELQDEQVASRQYQHTPLHEIQGWAGIQGDLFDTIIIFENYPVSKVISAKQWKLKVEDFQTTEQTNYPLSIIIGSAEEINIRFSYNSRLLEEAYVQEICGHFEHVLLQVIKNEKAILGDMILLTTAEENQLLVDFNDTEASYTQDKNIIDLFQEQVAATPGNTALVFEGERFSYKELNERSNQLAHFLGSKGVKEETLIPICIERSPAMIVAILGILKSGAAYVPIDPAYPEERINYILEDTGAGIVISSKESRVKIKGSQAIGIIEIENDWVTINQQPVHDLPVSIASHHLAYVIYTSGSTGKPKGVMLEHGNLYSFICWCRHEFSTSRFDIVYATTSVCFDLSVFEIFYPLSIGKPVRIMENGLRMGKYLSEDSYVLTNTVPVIIQHLLQEGVDLSNISVMNMAGEPIPLYVQQNLDTEKTEVRNLYGPTEDTTYSTVFRLTKNKRVLIGKPIANTTVQIVNNKGRLVPIGVPGEIYLGGGGLARGYLNRAELTREKFISGTFNKTVDTRLYRTGDIGRWLPDGNIEYLGRIDDQVKIRGFRIELGEIETILLQSGLVSKAVVLAKEDEQGNKRLVGYIVAEGEFNKDAIQSWLYSKLPDHMIPSIWVTLERMPLTPNGKIDRKSLPNPDSGELLMTKYVAPRNEMETALAGIWEKLLGKEAVGVDDNFFELGGDSILTIQVVSRARRMGYEVQPKDIFIHQTIGRLSKAIEDRSVAVILGEQDVLTGLSGLLPIQQWYLENEQVDNAHFNQAIILGIDKMVTASELNYAFGLLMEHHDALRFSYSHQNGRWQQEYGTYKGSLVTEGLQSIPKELFDSTITQLASAHQRSLDIEKGELVRVVWMQTPGTEMNNRLLIIIHHLAIDGVSWRILLEDLELLLNGIKEGGKTGLAHKGSSYRQWYHALENYGRSKGLLSQVAYWRQAVKSHDALPVDKDYTGVVKIKEMAEYIVKLGSEQTNLLLQEVPRVYHTEINDILLAALARTIAGWSEKDTVTIGLEGHGREEMETGIEISRTIGWFTSLYPLLLAVQRNRGEDELIKSVKEQLRQVPDKGLGYGVLKYINKETSLQGKDPWDIVFNYLGQLDNVVRESKWLSGVSESTGTGRSKEQAISEKLSVNALVKGGKLVINWSYSTRHYDGETVKTLAEAYLTNLKQLIDQCMRRQKSGLVYTPSDYGLGSDVSYEELDRFLEGDDNDNIISF